jgi:hypothetical protein
MRMTQRVRRLEEHVIRRDVEAMLATTPHHPAVTADVVVQEMRRVCALPVEDWRAYYEHIYATLSPAEVAEADALRLTFRAILCSPRHN